MLTNAMKANGVITSVLCVGAVVGMAAWLAVERQARLKLGEEHKALEQKLGQMAGLIAENQRLSNLLAQADRPPPLPDDQLRELLRLRGEVGLLREQSKELETVRNENRRARAALENSLKTQGAGAAQAAATADYWPRGSWAFAGQATPDAALQTSLWAANNGDLKALLASVTGELQENVEKDLAGKSEDEASIRAMDEVSGLKSVHVLNREAKSYDTFVLTAAFEDRTQTHTQKLVLKKIGNDWKLSGPAE
jgi:hypothetical protein